MRARIVDLVAPLDEAAGKTPVPACPEWSVQDVVAHTTGNCADILTGNVQGSATDAWTAAQVETRKGWKLGDVLAEWDDVGPQIAEILDDFPGRYAKQIVGDLTVHEHDIRGALNRPGAWNSKGLAVGSDFIVTTMVQTGAVSPAWDLSRSRPASRNGSSGPASRRREIRTAGGKLSVALTTTPRPAKPIVGTVSTTTFELFRAVTGRRSAAQIRGFEWSLDPEPFLPIFGYGPFEIRPTNLDE